MAFETFDRRQKFEEQFYAQLRLIRIYFVWLRYNYRN